MMLTPQGGPALESGLSMAMAAAGTRGELLAGGASGFELAFKADALWVGTSIDGVDGPAGRLKATDAAVTRFRTGLEGSRAYTFGGRLSLKPSVEVGLRHDGGDAETGAGMDIGGGLVVSDASTGLAVDVRVRTLLVHQDQNFSERGVSLSVSYKPDAVDAAGLCGARGAVVGRSGDGRGFGVVGPRDDGRHGGRRLRAGQPPRWRRGLRAAGWQPLRGDAAGRLQRLGVRPGLSGRLRPGLARPGEPGVRGGGRGATPQQSDAGRHEQRHARAGQHRGGRAAKLGVGFDALVCASGSALTQVGLRVGLRVLPEAVPFYGIAGGLMTPWAFGSPPAPYALGRGPLASSSIHSRNAWDLGPLPRGGRGDEAAAFGRLLLPVEDRGPAFCSPTPP